jgi:hypothetical protein
MNAKANIKLGNVQYQFEIEEKDEMDTLHKIIVLTNPRTSCNLCGNTDKSKMYFTSNKDKEGNTYVNVKCVCGARSKLGQYKTGGYFWHDFEKYVPETKKITESEQDSIDIGDMDFEGKL